MRVISGSARSIRLNTIEGNDTRPTTDRIKETLFNMIHDKLYDCRFLDLFSGSGAIGIEALSRHAASCVFVDSSKKCFDCINANLKKTHLEDRAHVLLSKVQTAINKLDGEEAFDIIFMDPPYDNNLEKDILSILKGTALLNSDTLIIVEASIKTDFNYLNELGYEIVKEKNYKTNKHVFIRMALTN